MGKPKLLGGNPITDEDPMQVTGGTGIGTTADTTSDNTVIGRLKNLLSRWPATLGQAAASASVPVVLASDSVITPGTGATHLGKAEDAAHASGDVGVMALSVRKDTAAALAGADGEYAPLEVDANGRLHVIASSGITGNVASGAADSGNPVKVGGVYNSPRPTLTNGQRGDLQLNSRGEQVVEIIGVTDGVAVAARNPNADAVDFQNRGSVNANAVGWLFGGTNFDRQRNNVEATALASAARVATTNSPDITTYNARGIVFLLNVTANPGGIETLSLKLQVKEAVSGNYIDVADAGVLLTAANGTKGLEVYPGILAADLVAGLVGKSSSIAGRTVRAVVTHSAAGSWTYSLSSILLV